MGKIVEDNPNNIDTERFSVLPNPKVSRKTKDTLTWKKKTIEYFLNQKDIELLNRRSNERINSNWDFFNEVMTSENINSMIDPFGLRKEKGIDKTTPNANLAFYGICKQPLETLFGEELKRKNDVRALALNPDVINQKDVQFKEEIKDYFNKLVQQETVDPEQVKIKLKEFDKYSQKGLTSSHEKMANSLLNIFKKDIRISSKLKFNTGFKNYQINNENIYYVYDDGDKSNFRAVDSRNFYVLGLNTNWIEDAYCWIEETWINPYKVLEMFPNLTSSEEKKVLSYDGSNSPLTTNNVLIEPNFSVGATLQDGIFTKAENLGANVFQMLPDSSVTNDKGDIKVVFLQWVSRRKVGELTYLDPTTGEEMTELVDENYPINLEANENVKWVYVNEIYEGTKILDDIYHNVRPIKTQMRSSITGKVRPTYVGYINFNNGGIDKSRLERLIPYQDSYNVFWNKLQKLWVQHIGKVGIVDVAKMPSDMNSEEWLMWIKEHNLMFENSFEIGNEGMAKGQLAGNMQQGSRSIDLSLMEEINNTIGMLNFIGEKVNEIASVPNPRQGAMSGNEGLGVSQQAIISSANQTEQDFYIHDIIKAKVAETWLEYTKVINKDTTKLLQYHLDDLTQHILNLDGKLLNETEYGVQITSSTQSFELSQRINSFIHPAMQNGLIGIADAISLMDATPSEMLDKLKLAEEAKYQQQKEMEQMKQQQAQQQMQAARELKEYEAEIDSIKRKEDHEYKMQELMFSQTFNVEQHSRDTNQNHIDDEVELDLVKLQTESDKELLELKLQQEKDLKVKEEKHKEKLQEEELKTRKEIEEIKIKNSNTSKKK